MGDIAEGIVVFLLFLLGMTILIVIGVLGLAFAVWLYEIVGVWFGIADSARGL